MDSDYMSVMKGLGMASNEPYLQEEPMKKMSPKKYMTSRISPMIS